MKDIQQRLKRLEEKHKGLADLNAIETFYYKDGRIEYIKEVDAVRKVLTEKGIDHIEPSYPLLNALIGAGDLE